METGNLFEGVNALFSKVYEKFNKTENEVNEDVEVIKKWLQNQPHLPETMRESHIRNFLILNKFSIERTKQKIDMYYTIRSLVPHFFGDCNPKLPQMRAVFDNTFIGMHPKLHRDLYRVFFVKINKLLLREFLRVTVNIAEVRFLEDCYVHSIYVIDLSNFTLNDIAKLTPPVLMEIFAIYEKLYSLPLEAAHVINASPYISKTMAFLKSILKPKIFQRIHVYDNDDVMKEIFTSDYLPKDYGGNGPTLQELTSMLRSKFDEHESRFDLLDKMRVDENLRPEKLVDDDVLGFHGHFKQLNID